MPRKIRPITSFIALDVETANPSYASICQVGLAYFSDGVLSDTWKTYVDPQVRFSSKNISIHGIKEEMVAGAIKIPELLEELDLRFRGKIIAHHTAFDKLAIHQAAQAVPRAAVECMWLDTALVTRRAWLKYRDRGYGLDNLCNEFGICFEHHDALEDARAAGEILLLAMKETNLTLEEWLINVQRSPGKDFRRLKGHSRPEKIAIKKQKVEVVPIAETISERPAFCSECGKPLMPTANFCGYCGTRITIN